MHQRFRKLAPAIIGVALIAAGPAVAQAQHKTIDLPFIANEGQEFAVKITTVEKKTVQDEVTEHSSHTSTYDGQIVKANSNGYVIGWIAKSLDWEILADKRGTVAMKARLAREAGNAFKDIPTVFEANAAGTPVLIHDWPATSKKLVAVMRDGLNNALRERLASASSSKPKEEVEAAVKSQVDQLLKTMILRHDERSAVILFEEAALIGSAQHRSWLLGVPSEDATLAPSLLSDANVPRKSKVTLRRYDTQKDEAEVIWSNIYDPAVLRTFAWDVIQAQSKAAKLDSEKLTALKTVFDTANFTRTDGGRAIISIKDGWTRHIELTVRTVGEVPGQPKTEEVKSKVIEIAKKT